MNQDLFEAPKYFQWKKTLEESGCSVHGVEPLAQCHHNGKLLFALVRADVSDPDGKKILPLCLIRGHACVIIPWVFQAGADDSTGLFLMVKQRRIANGHHSLEFPAGMVDENIHKPLDVALKELEEETGVKARPDDLHALTDSPLYSTPGLNDEAIHYYGCKLQVSPKEWQELKSGRKAGIAIEGENLDVGLWSQQDALREVSSLQVVLGFHLFRSHFG